MPDRFATRLAAEVQNWVRDGLLSADQVALITGGRPHLVRIFVDGRPYP